MSTTPADEFFARCGVMRHRGAAEFWTALAAECGRDAVGEIEAVLARRSGGAVDASDVAVFSSDPQRQRATLDVAAPHTFEWLNVLAGITQVRAALDLGCGGGIATCLIAFANPAARVVGVDANPVAIATASQVAGELGLDNVEFHVAELSDADFGRDFDLVVSSAVWAETDDWAHAAGRWSALNDLPALLRTGSARSVLAQAAARHLADDGMYVSLERCHDLAGLAAWVAAQQNEGLNVDLSRSDMLTIDGALTGPERLPLVTTHRGVQPANTNDLVQWRLRVGDERLDDHLLAEVVMSSGGDWALVDGTLYEAAEDDDRFSVALLLLERGTEAKLYFSTTRGVREILASSPDGGADQFRALYRSMRQHLGERPSVVSQRAATTDDAVAVVPRAVTS